MVNVPSFLLYVMFPAKGGNSKKLRFSSFASLRECRKRDIVPKRVWQCLFPTFHSALCAYFNPLGKSMVGRWLIGAFCGWLQWFCDFYKMWYGFSTEEALLCTRIKKWYTEEFPQWSTQRNWFLRETSYNEGRWNFEFYAELYIENTDEVRK